MTSLPSPYRYIAVIGPTASGKSALALALAQGLGGELINCDSVQLYRGFQIGAAKPSQSERESLPHHLWDVVDWNEGYDAWLYAEAAEACVAAIHERGACPVLVGGTGLYLRALWRENWHDLPKSETLRQELAELPTAELYQRLLVVDPQRAASLHPNDRFRLQRALEVALLLGHPLSQLPVERGRREEAFVISVDVERDELHRRIGERTAVMLATGLIAEVEQLLASGVDPACKPMQSIGYAQVLQYVSGQIKREELEEAIIIATRQYAKRQETWFRKVQPNVRYRSGQSIETIIETLQTHGLSQAEK